MNMLSESYGMWKCLNMHVDQRKCTKWMLWTQLEYEWELIEYERNKWNGIWIWMSMIDWKWFNLGNVWMWMNNEHVSKIWE